MDLIAMVNAMRGLTAKEQAKVLKVYGVKDNLEAVVECIAELHGSKQDQKMAGLLKSIHYGQLLNFDYKFQITTADSLI